MLFYQETIPKNKVDFYKIKLMILVVLLINLSDVVMVLASKTKKIVSYLQDVTIIRDLINVWMDNVLRTLINVNQISQKHVKIPAWTDVKMVFVDVNVHNLMVVLLRNLLNALMVYVQIISMSALEVLLVLVKHHLDVLTNHVVLFSLIVKEDSELSWVKILWLQTLLYKLKLLTLSLIQNL